MSTALTVPEQAELEQLEATIEKGMETFVEVGVALMTIREKKLYQNAHESFEEYCRERWKIGRRRAEQLISAAGVFHNLLPLREVANHGSQETPEVEITLPASERQTRPLVGLEPTEQRDAWKASVDASRNGKPTSDEVEETVKRRSTGKHEGAAARDKAAERLARQQSSQAEEAEDKPLTDQEGRAVPEKAAPAFQQIGEINAACRQIDDLVKEVERLGKSPVGVHLHFQSVQTHLRNAKNGVWTARPTHICPYCKGLKKVCDVCRANGWVTATTYKAAPEELKK